MARHVLPGKRAHIARVYDGDNTMMAPVPARASRPGGRAPDRPAGRGPKGLEAAIEALIYAGFGEFHGHPELDLAEDLVELFVPGAVLEISGDGFEPQKRR